MSVYDNSNNLIENTSDEPKTPFWGTNPNVLLKDMHELFPIDSMEYQQMLNSVTRLVILLTIITLLFTRSIRTLIIGAATLFLIYIIHYYQSQKKENFENPTDEIVKENNIQTNDVFDEPTKSNPFGNVLVTDIEFNPEKKPAPPAFNKDINEKIMKESKQMVQDLNPDQPNISDKLFKDLGEQYVFEQSLRQFHSNPNTQIVNDQTGFAEFCYGNMVSCKEGNLFACARNLTNYNLY